MLPWVTRYLVMSEANEVSAPLSLLMSSLRWHRSDNHEPSLGKPIFLRSTSVRLSSTLPFTALLRRQAITSGPKLVVEAQAATSSAVHSASLDGARTNIERGLVGGSAEEVAGTGESGGDTGGALSAGFGLCITAGLRAMELSSEFSFSEHLF